MLVKVCSINFEPPGIDICYACHLDYFNIYIIYIEQTDLGVGFHNLMNNLKLLTFRVNTFQFLLSMTSQLNVKLHKESFLKEKRIMPIRCDFDKKEP